GGGAGGGGGGGGGVDGGGAGGRREAWRAAPSRMARTPPSRPGSALSSRPPARKHSTNTSWAASSASGGRGTPRQRAARYAFTTGRETPADPPPAAQTPPAAGRVTGQQGERARSRAGGDC